MPLEKCRKFLGRNSPESDLEMEKLRDHVYAFAHFAVEILPQRPQGSVSSKPNQLTPVENINSRGI